MWLLEDSLYTMSLRKTLIASLLARAALGTLFDFTPDNDTQILDQSYPLQTNWTALQLSTSGSIWSSSFVTASDGNQYLILSHTLPQGNSTGVWRGSIEGITDPSVYVDHSEGLSNLTRVPGILNVTYENFTYSALTTDGYSVLQTTSSTSGYSYNITSTATSRTILNWGGNQWPWGPSLSTEWGLPRCRTEGTFSIDGNETLTIDPSRSFTWYDRQPGGAGGNWTWFELHFPDENIVASIWFNPLSDGNMQEFATIRTGEGTVLASTTLSPFANSTWVSAQTGHTYYSDWIIHFQSGDSLRVKTVKTGRELYAASPFNIATVEAFAIVESGSILGKEVSNGYGLVEISPRS